MLSEFSETPLKQVAANIIGSDSGRDINLENGNATRKIEFDRGIPLSFEFASNEVMTIDYSPNAIVLIVLRKIFSQPLHILMLVLFAFYTISYIVVPDVIRTLNLATTIYVHVFIFIIEIVAELYKFYKIYQNDKKTNSQPARIYDIEHKSFVLATWADIRVGHIIRVNKDEIVPADIILIETMDSSHQCFLDVSAITGVFDTFITKKACNDTQAPSMKTIKFNEYVKNIKGMLKYEEPNSHINSFNGRLKIESFPRAGDVTEENFVMRGATIKNIKSVYGIVVYTGMETKIMQILKSDKQNNINIIKRDRNIFKTTYNFIQYLLICLYIIIIFLLGFEHIHKSYISLITQKNDASYLMLNRIDSNVNGDIETISNKRLVSFFEFYISLFQYTFTFQLILPFTWFNLIALAYLIFKKFLVWDIKVRQQYKNSIDIINSSCLYDFGQVRYILTDKTGTLTSRKFILKACSIKGKLYPFDPLEKKDENYIFRMKKGDYIDLELYQEIKSNTPSSEFTREFLEYLCVCHSAKIRSRDSTKSNIEDNEDKIFGSSYAEDRATLKMLSKLGYVVTKTKNNMVNMEINKKPKTYYVVGTNRYSDERKRMSVIIKRSKNDNESILLCKGSDPSILNLVSQDNEAEVKILKEQIQKLSSIGYRYFIFCKRNLTEDDTSTYMTKFKSAENYVLQREIHFEKLAEEYEVHMEILGVLFFEEKVRNDLRYTINKLNNSDIHVWVVSGDKKENVLAVSRNLDMLNTDGNVVEFSEKDNEDDLDIKMNMFLMQMMLPGEQMLRMKTRRGVDINVEANKTNKTQSKELTILLHGNCFNTIIADSRLYQCFATLLSYCKHLFAYSFTANNKFLLTQMVKKYVTKNSKVLAIGDGLNDFMMLKEADLSIGIRSWEILQVRNTCDVIVRKFPQILDLILVHGTWNFKRLVTISFFSFYANMLIIMPFFWHQTSNPLGSTFFETNYTKLTMDILVINLMIIMTISFDIPIERPLIGLNPYIYLQNFQSKKEILAQLGKSFCKSIVDSLIIYYSFYVLRNPLNILGENIDGNLIGNFIQYTTYIAIIFKLVTFELNSYTWITFVLIFISFGGIFGLTFIDPEIVYVMYQGASYLNMILCSIFAVLICYIYEKILSSLYILINPGFIYNLTLRFKNFIKDYVLFVNFERIIKEIANAAFVNKHRVDKINFQEVLEKIHDHNENIDTVLENMTDINNDQIATMKIKKPFLRFLDGKLESDYSTYTRKNIGVLFICFLITLFLFWLVDICLQAGYSDLWEEKITKILKIVYILVGLILLLKPLKTKFNVFFTYYYYLYLCVELICIYVEKSNNDTKIAIQNFILFTFPLFFANRSFKIILTGVILYYVGIIPSIYLNDSNFSYLYNDPYFLFSNLPLLYHKTLFIFGTLAIMVIYSYYEELTSRIDFLKYNKRTVELKKDEEIYSNLVPEFVRDKMKKGIRGAAIEYQVVSILFCDISEFDRLMARMTPKEIIFLLDRIYNTFDQLCQIHGLQKIETVGKTYMASGGIKECEKDFDPITLSKHHAVRCFELGVDMLDIMQKMRLENGEIVKIKIGIHTGKVISAVVGSHKPQFSLIGDAVNTTARMCGYSSDNCINCSEFSYEHISKFYNDFQVSTKDVKGKGVMNLYLHNPFKNKQGILESKIKLMKETTLFLRKDLNKKMTRQGSKRTVEGTTNAILAENNKFKRQNSQFSNFSNFIYEDSKDLPAEEHPLEEKSPKKDKRILSKSVTHNPEALNVTSDSNVETNTIFNKSKLFLKFNSVDVKEHFRTFETQKFAASRGKSTVMNFTFVVIYLLGIYNFSQYALVPGSLNFSFMIVKLVLSGFLILIISETERLIETNPARMRLINSIIFMCFTITCQVHMNYVPDFFLLNIVMEQILIIIVVTYNGLLFYQQIAMNLLIYILAFVINIGVNWFNPFIVKYLVFIITICIILFIFLVLRYFISTFEYLRNKREAKNLKDMEKLLFNLMPQHVIQNLKEDIPVADVLYNVTMLFADIVNFTVYSSQREPAEVVNMLSQLFKDFDDSCQANNVYKVHTIGDCYVVMSFTGKVPLNERNYREEARNVVNQGERMIEIIRKVRKDVEFEDLDMRIGIHTGTVIAGIIGTKVVRYDIFGSDVLIANKMESGGEKGRINISEDTKMILEGNDKEGDTRYIYTQNKTISVQSVNKEIKSYFIDRNTFD